MPIVPAKIHFNEQGVPVAESFDDVYFSNQSGLEESRYVFIKNNQLPQRWLEQQNANSSIKHVLPFVIAETGFGSGLNFLAVWELYKKIREETQQAQAYSSFPQLHFISVEKFPMSPQEIAKANAPWEALQPLVEELTANYPAMYPGCHRIELERGNVILDLWFGDIDEVLPDIQIPEGGLVDAWFLDGFAPDKNPQMWQPKLYQQMVRLSKVDGTFATFTAAGQVRRDMKASGLTVEKRKGFGRKREMLAGYIEKKPSVSTNKPWYVRAQAKSNSKHITIIGGGIASSSCALALAKKGYDVTLYCKDNALAQAASGNRQAGFYPQLQADMNTQSLIYLHCFDYARRHYNDLLKKGYDFGHDWCGVNMLAFTPALQERYQNLVAKQQWPDSTFTWLTPEQTTQKAGVELPYWSLFFEHAGWLNPPELIKAQINAAQSMGQLEVIYNKTLKALERDHESIWQLTWHDGTTEHADILLLNTGADAKSRKLPYLDSLPLSPVRGQIEHITSVDSTHSLSTVLCHKGYFTPALNGLHTLGSTYVKHDDNSDYRVEESQKNLQTQIKALDSLTWPHDLKSDHQGRASIRCSTPDRFPMMGSLYNEEKQKHQFADLYKAMPDSAYPIAESAPNLYTLTGLGSRGICTAPLLAEAIACQISGQPMPLSLTLLNALNPNRFLIRHLIRRTNL